MNAYLLKKLLFGVMINPGMIQKFENILEKETGLKSKRTTDWRNYKKVRNKVNNLKRHAKERFYYNLKLNLTESFTNNKRDFWRLTRYFVEKNGCRVGIHVSKWLCTRQPYKILSQIGYIHGCRMSTYNCYLHGSRS